MTHKNRIWALSPRMAISLLTFMLAFSLLTFNAMAQTAVYNAVPSVLAPAYPSQPFQAQQTNEFGDYVHLAGTSRVLNSVTFTMVTWAHASTPANVTYCTANPLLCTGADWKHNFTINIYQAPTGTPGTRDVGALVATITQQKSVPWRPAPDPVNCPTKDNPGYDYKWQAVPGPADTNCYNGFAYNVTFDMSSLNAVLPNDIVVGIVYNTQTYGPAPLGVDGPFNSLNVGVPNGNTASVGTDDNSDMVFWNTETAGYYADGGVSGTDEFREDSNWGVYGTIPIEVTATPIVRWVDNSDGQAGPTSCSDTNAAHTTIVAAITAASSGDIIKVCPGTYNESPQITKSLTIQSTGGRNVTNVQLLPSGSPGTGYLAGFYINSATADVVIDGFTIIGNDAANPVLANSNVVVQTANSVMVTNSRLKVGATDGGTNLDDGMGVITTYGSGAGAVTVSNNEIMPVNAAGARAFYINPATGTSFSFQNNQVTGHFVSSSFSECGGTIANNTVTGTGSSGGLGFDDLGGPACGGAASFTNNSVTGALRALRIYGVNNVVLTSNSVTGNGTGISLESAIVTGTVAHYNRIANNTTAGIDNGFASTVDAENNWWGCNYGPGASGAGCPVAANGITGAGAASVDADPWLTLTSSASAPVVVFSGTSNVNSALTMNSLGADTSGGGNVPNGTSATYVATLGTAAPNPSTTTAGLTQTVFTAGVVPGAGGVATTVDGQTLNVPIGVYANLCATVSTPVLTSLPNVPISIPINIDETSGRGIIGFDVTLTYETDTLNPSGITATLGPVAAGAGYNINTSTAGTIVISIFSSTPFSGAGTLINLNFLNTGGIGESTPLTLSGLVLNGTLVCGTTSSGSLTIVSGNMTGKVTYENHAPGYPVPNVNLNAPGPPAVAGLTDVNGDYTLSGFGAGSQTVTPSKAPMNWLTPNGIFSNDASDISKYVVGLIPLNPVQLRAAKVSGNATPFLSSFDAALIAQWIVGIPNPINKTGTWTFTNTSNTYPNVNVNITGQDYLALLLGDVTGDWVTGPLARPAARGMMPSENAVRASVDASEAEKGSIVNIPFKIENLKGAPVTSYQFDIEYDPNVLEADRVAATVEETVSSGLSVVSNAPKPGLLKVVVFGALPVTSDGVYVNLKFAAIGEIGSRSPINIRGFRFNDGSAETTTADSEVVVTAAKNIGIKGRLLTAMGEPVAADVTLSAFGKRGVVGTTRSGADGRFEFGGLDVGRTYTIKVRSKEYRFEPVIVSYADNAVNLDLIALP